MVRLYQRAEADAKMHGLTLEHLRDAAGVGIRAYLEALREARESAGREVGGCQLLARARAISEAAIARRVEIDRRRDEREAEIVKNRSKKESARQASERKKLSAQAAALREQIEALEREMP
jgi:hypothetical protein